MRAIKSDQLPITGNTSPPLRKAIVAAIIFHVITNFRQKTMTNYAIFDEKYYLSQYPWIQPAIDAGVIKSGREHFEKFGREGGLTKVSRYFDEAT